MILSHISHISNNICIDTPWGTWGRFSGMSSACVLMSLMWQNILNIPEWLPDLLISMATMFRAWFLAKILFMWHIWEHQEYSGQGIFPGRAPALQENFKSLGFAQKEVWGRHCLELKGKLSHPESTASIPMQPLICSLFISPGDYSRGCHIRSCISRQRRLIAAEVPGKPHTSSMGKESKAGPSLQIWPGLREHGLHPQRWMCFTQWAKSGPGRRVWFDLSSWDPDLPWLRNPQKLCPSLEVQCCVKSPEVIWEVVCRLGF